MNENRELISENKAVNLVNKILFSYCLTEVTFQTKHTHTSAADPL